MKLQQVFLLRFHGNGIRHGLGRRSASFQGVVTVNSGCHRTTQPELQLLRPLLGRVRVSLIDNLWESRGEGEPASTLTRALSSSPGGSGNDQVVRVTDITKWLSTR